MEIKARKGFQQLDHRWAEASDSNAFYGSAQAYYDCGDYERALAVLRRGLERHTHHVAGFVLMGRVLMARHRYREAQVTFERVLELDPSDPQARQALAEISGELELARTPRLRLNLPHTLTSNGSSSSGKDSAVTPETRSKGEPVAAMPWDEPVAAAPAVLPDSAVDPEPAGLSSPQPSVEAEFLKSNLLATVTEVDEDEVRVDTTAIAIADLLVGLLEYRDPFFRGGTSLTRLLTTAIAREMKLPASETSCYVLGAVLRDLGQVPLKGLISTPGEELGAAGKRQVETHVDTALEMLAAINLPIEVRETIRFHHERWDGSGYPERRRGDGIPVGARIVAVADAFAAMISARPHRLPHSVPSALEEIKSKAGVQFDPEVVDALVRVLQGSDWRGVRFGLRHHVLIVDSDETRAMVLATKLCSHGYLAEAAFDVDTAQDRLNRTQIDGLVVSGELAEGAPPFLRSVRDNARLAMMPVLITDAGVAHRVELLEAGGDVCLAKGSSFDEIKATFEAFFRREGKLKPASKSGGEWAGLQGDIQDFPLQWLMQVLNYDSRTAAIFLMTENEEGVIFVNNGQPRHARTKRLNGEAALRHMLGWHRGSFTVDPEARTEEHTISTPLMNLLLDQAVQEDHAAFFGAVKT